MIDTSKSQGSSEGDRSSLGDRIANWLRRLASSLDGGDWGERILFGGGSPGARFFKRQQRGVVETYERSVRIMVTGLFSGTGDDTNLKFFEDSLSNLPADDMAARFSALQRIDGLLVTKVSLDRLKARRWLYIDRFRRVASPRAYLAYEASLPAATDTERAKVETDLRADLTNLNMFVQTTQILNLERERALASIKYWLLTRTVLLLGVIALVFILSGIGPLAPWLGFLSVSPAFHAFLLVALVGMIGAITSISRKFQDLAKSNVLEGDPFNEIVSLNAGRASVGVSILTGGIFAVLLYAIIVAGASSGLDLGAGLLPSMSDGKSYALVCPNSGSTPQAPTTAPTSPPAQATPPALTDTSNPPSPLGQTPPSPASCPEGKTPEVRQLTFSDANVPRTIERLSKQGLGFSFAADLYRMLLLAFNAGFAERLIPDSIDRLIRREKAASGTS